MRRRVISVEILSNRYHICVFVVRRGTLEEETERCAPFSPACPLLGIQTAA